MKLVWIAAVLACASIASLAPHRASASTATDCQAQITNLRAATDATTFSDDKQGGKTKSQLLFHLDKAFASLNAGDKYDTKDALRQMKGYLTDLANAVQSGRVSSTDAAPLQSGANDVVSCIQSIQ